MFLHVLVTLELFSLELQLQIAAVDNTATEYCVSIEIWKNASSGWTKNVRYSKFSQFALWR